MNMRLRYHLFQSAKIRKKKFLLPVVCDWVHDKEKGKLENNKNLSEQRKTAAVDV